MNQFPTRQELETMSVVRLRNLNIETLEQEHLVQEVLDARRQDISTPVKIYRGDVPFMFKNKDEELHWQKILDEREAVARNAGLPEEKVLENKIQELEEKKSEIGFCAYCSAKGPIKHQKNCTRPK